MESESYVQQKQDQTPSCGERNRRRHVLIQAHFCNRTRSQDHRFHHPLHLLQPLDSLRITIHQPFLLSIQYISLKNQFERVEGWSVTFDAFVTGFALGTRLVALASLVLVASSTDRESTLVTRHERLSIV